MHTTMVPVQVKTMKIQAGVQVSRPGELRRHLQLWKRFGRRLSQAKNVIEDIHDGSCGFNMEPRSMVIKVTKKEAASSVNEEAASSVDEEAASSIAKRTASSVDKLAVNPVRLDIANPVSL
ncbi:hypothetical protein Tco_0729903 [Tanacetum coccineum]|uniref:Uncharacterized protein n=1 Tax=Tanacetum coccineum TaxID=301880 RepID=A0ABQ4YSZ8_9ASTR